MTKSEAQILAGVMDNTRNLTRWYLSLLKEVDPHKVFKTADGTALNTVHWLTCHLAWAEHFLILKAIDGKEPAFSWLNNYGLGSNPEQLKDTDQPTMKEAIHALKTIHSEVTSMLHQLPDHALDEQSLIGANFGGDSSKRMMVHHAIRHESCHTGHLGWLCKFYGIKTI